MTANRGQITSECGQLIGIWGDRSCPELKTHTHCRNCPVYSAGGRNLLERVAPAGYVSEWTDLLAEQKEATAKGTVPVVIFRLGVEWLALPAGLFQEVTPVSPVRTLPHRSNDILLGLVNIRGELQMCVSLSSLLRLDAAPAPAGKNINSAVYKRMVVVEKEGNRWVFPVDEIYGVHRITTEEVRNAPATVSKVPDTYIKGMISWREESVSYLDDELLFYTLNKRLL
ncbi:MAG: chemotaxis protein CheW [Oscillatoria princeps RMCB-10]|jgi:chemotaxis-related protein WspD|nr:chemotaxis protein CheW [Oscillatoria princeps RMCB-10]